MNLLDSYGSAGPVVGLNALSRTFSGNGLESSAHVVKLHQLPAHAGVDFVHDLTAADLGDGAALSG